jgi:hypothetical protein
MYTAPCISSRRELGGVSKVLRTDSELYSLSNARIPSLSPELPELCFRFHEVEFGVCPQSVCPQSALNDLHGSFFLAACNRGSFFRSLHV